MADVPTNLSATPATPTMAEFVLSWSAPQDPSYDVTLYEVGLTLAGVTDPIVVVSPVFETHAPIPGLYYGVEMKLYVRAVGSDSVPRAWSDPYTFTLNASAPPSTVDNTLLATVAELGVALKINIPSSDAYAQLMLSHASGAVRDYAGRPGWVRNLSDPAVEGEEVAPAAARQITLWVACRAFTNPRNLRGRSSGPISESFENGLWAMELTPSEKERLDGITGGNSSSGSLWFLPIEGYGTPSGPVIVPTVAANDPEFLMNPMQIATEDQLPWTTNPPADGGDLTYG